MASLQGPVVCPVIRAKQTGGYSVPLSSSLLKADVIRSAFWGLVGISCGGTNVKNRHCLRNCKTIQCTFSSSSNGNGSTAGNPNESDSDYVNSSVIEAAISGEVPPHILPLIYIYIYIYIFGIVEVRSGRDGFMIKMRDGQHLRCVHNNPQGSHRPDYAPHPAIVLKIEDGSGLLLPIIVLEMPSVLLMAAVRNVHLARPTIYQVAKDMVEKMGYAVKHIRVTKRIHEAYFA